MHALTSPLANALIFNMLWFGCVAGRYDYLWLVAPAVLAYAALLVYTGRIEPRQMTLVIVAGILIDSFYTATGVFRFDEATLLLPLWMCVLWVAFATTLPLSMKLFGKNVYIAALTGAWGFPFSYFIGQKLGAISFGLPFAWMAFLVGITWAIMLPIMYQWMLQPRSLNHEKA
ncbi:MAG: hypothetical protein RLZZ385_2458 [Pseudomonadota bacterium]|jgi:hypothetical protein